MTDKEKKNVYVAYAFSRTFLTPDAGVIGVGDSIAAAQRCCNRHFLIDSGIISEELVFHPVQAYTKNNEPYDTGTYFALSYMANYQIEPFELETENA